MMQPSSYRRSPLLETTAQGGSALQLGLLRPAQAASAAASFEVPTANQGQVALTGAARAGHVAQRSMEFGASQATYAAQAEQAQAPKSPQQLRDEGKIRAMAKYGMLDPGSPSYAGNLVKLPGLFAAG